MRNGIMELEADEEVILDEGHCGRHKILVLTNQRLLVLKNDDIDDEIPLADIAEAYPETETFTNLTKLKIRTGSGDERTIGVANSSNLGILLGGDEYMTQSKRSTVDRYAVAINRAVDSLQK